nr:MinD/ParA family protein [Nocardiopsis trehalosi]
MPSGDPAPPDGAAPGAGPAPAPGGYASPDSGYAAPDPGYAPQPPAPEAGYAPDAGSAPGTGYTAGSGYTAPGAGGDADDSAGTWRFDAPAPDAGYAAPGAGYAAPDAGGDPDDSAGTWRFDAPAPAPEAGYAAPDAGGDPDDSAGTWRFDAPAPDTGAGWAAPAVPPTEYAPEAASPYGGNGTGHAPAAPEPARDEPAEAPAPRFAEDVPEPEQLPPLDYTPPDAARPDAPGPDAGWYAGPPAPPQPPYRQPGPDTGGHPPVPPIADGASAPWSPGPVPSGPQQPVPDTGRQPGPPAPPPWSPAGQPQYPGAPGQPHPQQPNPQWSGPQQPYQPPQAPQQQPGPGAPGWRQAYPGASPDAARPPAPPHRPPPPPQQQHSGQPFQYRVHLTGEQPAVGQQPPSAPETSDALNAEALVSPKRRGPAKGWRKAIHSASFGLLSPGESAAELRRQELAARARTHVAGGHHRVAVLSLKGGVGKTTTTVALGSTLASLRGDRVLAVDANPDRGTLSDKVRLETAATIRDLLNEKELISRYADIRGFTSQAASRLEILASDRDPAVSEAFSESDYREVSRILEHYYSICLTDCGTGLLHSAMRGVLGLADQVVLVSSASVDGARSASATLDWLEAHQYGYLVRGAVVVLSMVRTDGRSSVDLDRLEQHFASRCRAVVRVPWDSHLEEGAEVDLDRLSPATRDAYLQLAATVGEAFAWPR